jgi:non-homologous end joining protein Ku
MAKTGRVALAQTVFHNKESLVLIRSVKRGLILHFLFFKNEIRDFGAITKGEGVKLPGEQLELGISLIEKMSSAAAPSRIGNVVDIMSALKQSLATSRPQRNAPAAASKRKRKA